ncbi:MAG: DcaP family trimeric outer membrane transporter [Candidatus Hinthialibacter antarcticus]|nr:DcaP family trimeric outer membrane transporter [Candidatus Hinthialibacter antarcticus]
MNNYVKSISIASLCFLTLVSVSPTFAQSTTDEIQTLKEQVQMLMQRVQTLEEKNSSLQNRLESTQSSVETTKEQIKTVSEQTQLNAAHQTNVVSSKYGANLYGYVKLDASYDDSRLQPGNYALYALSDSSGSDDDEFNVTANQSRLGFDLIGPTIGNAETGGKIEFDFYGGGAENKAHMRMRHAYAQIDWPEYEMSLLAGQTWDVISPLVPATLNFPVAWSAGNIGARRPQLRLTKNYSMTESTDLLLQAAITRTIGDDVAGQDTGSDSGFPGVQGRLAYSFPLLTDKPTTIGVSGHYGQEEHDGINKDLDTWSLNVDVDFPIWERIGLKGEFFTGTNLDTYFGGILQGVNTTIGEELPTTGGWAALSVTPMDKVNLNFGATYESPDDFYVMTDGRTQNSSYFGNIYYMFDPSLILGFEASYWDTKYKDLDDGDALRFQTSVIYKF